ncbi:MAG: RpiB/LacA/LacB family sugar-phosphate isomerase [Kaistella sp.]
MKTLTSTKILAGIISVKNGARSVRSCSKESIKSFLKKNSFGIADFGGEKLDNADDFPVYVIPLAKGVASGEILRGIAICGSGVGACIAANKISGVRAALITDCFSAHQGVEELRDLHLLKTWFYLF